jgi:hypothetical protein
LSSVDVPYDSPDYLGALKAAIEKDTPNFSATVAVLSEFGKTQKDLEDEPGIGRAVTASPEIPFAEYLMTSAAPLQTSADTAASTLQVMAPSVPLTDADGNIYICRFTEADKASRQHMSIVMDQVVRDAQTLQSMDMAHSAAQSLVDAVRLSGDLAKSAADFNRKLLVAGPVVPTQSATISDYPLKPESNQILMDQLRTMLLSPGMAGATLPISVVDLPPDRKVVVVQFNTIVPGWTANSLAGKTAAAQDDLMQNSLRPFLIDWCNIDAVSKRLDYEPLVAP